jgi:sulfite exporter TauE/SafE
MQNTNLLTIFLTGLLTGGLTCLAVQGGLLATAIAQRHEGEQETKSNKALPIIAFVIAKLIAYTIVGFLLGWLGSFFTLSFGVRVALQILIAVFMIGTALSLLDVHPFFRYFVIQPPRFLTRMVRSKSKSGDIFTPALLGLMTIFIPCGTTQAMMALAISSASALTGALIMFSFILGTIPLFFILGYGANSLSAKWQKNFYRAAAVLIIILSLFAINGAISLSGATWFSGNSNQVKSNQVVSKDITIMITNNGYVPNNLDVKAGEEITLTIKNENAYSCAQAFTIPKFGIEKVVAPGTEEVIKFTAPSDLGKIAFTCSMGMYRGVFNIVK